MSNRKGGGPPRFVEAALSACLPVRNREAVLGDLREEYVTRSASGGEGAASRWYLLEALRSVIPALRSRVIGRQRSPAGPPDPSGWMTDGFHALRSLRRSPGFVLVTALTLGVGVGSAGAVFGMASQLLLRPLPGIEDSDAVAFLEFLSVSDPGRRKRGISGPDIEELRRSATLLDGLASYGNIGVHASLDGGRPIDVRSVRIYGDYFEILGVRPAAGRLLTATENGPFSDPLVAVISERLWANLFDGSPDVVGRRFLANGEALTVVGVAGEGFAGPERGTDIDLWLPFSASVPVVGFSPERIWSQESIGHRDLIVRPQTGVDPEAARAQVDQILADLATDHADHGPYLSELRATVHPGLHTIPLLRDSTYRTLGTLAGTAFLVLLIACANVANLLLVRGIYARGELAVRRALGASARRMVRQRAVESLLLAAAGTFVGLAVAWLIGLAFRGESLWRLPAFEGFALDRWSLTFGLVAVIATTLLFGTVPAALAGRFDLGGALRNSETRATGRHSMLQGGMSALQVGLSMMLLVGSILLGRTVKNVYAVDAGLDAEGVTTVSLDFSTLDYEAPELEALYREVLAAVGDVPNVQSAALDTYGPYASRFMGRIVPSDLPSDQAEQATLNWVSPGWFELLGVEPLSGRTFRDPDWQASALVPVIVTEPLTLRLFGRTDVVGRSVRAGIRGAQEGQIVGVLGELRMTDLRSPPDEAFFLPYPPTFGPFATVLVRRRDANLQFDGALLDAVEAALPSIPVPEPTLLTDRIESQLTEQRILARLLGLLSSLSLLLASVGLYAVIAFTVAERRREFGIRVALGADGARIARLVMRSAVAIVAVGIALGLGGSYAASSALESVLFGVEPVDSASYVGAAALLAMVALVACLAPATTAMRVDPVTTLQQR